MKPENSSFQSRKGAWVTLPDAPPVGYVSYRRKFSLNGDACLRILVSADCRYLLRLDGELLGGGPARGDLEHYHYEVYERSLSAGGHELAATVVSWHGRYDIPWAEIHFAPAFLVLGSCGDADLDTPGAWECAADGSRRLLDRREAAPDCPWEIPAALTEEYTAALDDQRRYVPVKRLAKPCFADDCEGDPPSRWKLCRSEIPQMSRETIGGIRLHADGIATVRISEPGVICGTVPAGRHTMLVDLGRYCTHVPTLKTEGGRGALRMAYGESLCEADGTRRRRGFFDGGIIGGFGYGDRVVFRGGRGDFTPFWYRSGRFVELVFDLEEPLVLSSLSFAFTAYPLTLKADFDAPDDPVLNEIFAVAWHTARCCLHEHYEDCPYYEQLQYVGDTRIQALVSYIGAGDPVPGRNAIRQFDRSRVGSEITASRYPSNFRQVIPGFSLFWVLMIEDHFRWFGDISVIREHWEGIRAVLSWFEKRREDSGLIGHVGHWNFTDWSSPWVMGRSSRGTKLPETIVNMIYADACRAASFLGNEAGEDAAEYSVIRRRVLDAVNRCCYSAEEKLYIDVPGKPWFSQHVNAWAILCGAAPEERYDELIDAIMDDPRLSQCTLYFAFYLLEVMRKTGRAGEFRRIVGKWEDVLQWGFTTFPECPSVHCRSDCHGWSAGVFYQLLKFDGGKIAHRAKASDDPAGRVTETAGKTDDLIRGDLKEKAKTEGG